MFYETAQTVGPGWHRSYKPSHYEDMTWSPSTRHFRSPGSSPETYRRIIHTEDDFPTRAKEYDDEFFSGRRSPTFPRRIFKEVWTESPSPNHRFSERPRMFKRVFKPSHWDDEFERDMPNIRRVEREFGHNFDDSRPKSKSFDDEFEKRFNTRDLQKDLEEEFEKAEGRVHHIPIMVERRMEEMKSRFGRNSPPPERENEEDSEDWVGPQVQRLRKNFEPEDGFSSRYSHRVPRVDMTGKSRAFSNPIPETWDPHAVHTLPTRKAHKSSQSFDDSRHTVPPPKSVFRSYSETHEDIPKQPQQHSAAFRSHSDGHCPQKTYVTKIEVNLPSQKEELRSKYDQSKDEEHQGSSDLNSSQFPNEGQGKTTSSQSSEEASAKPKNRNKYDSPSMQQIAVVLQNVEDLVHRVDAYNGTGRDKQFRFLDEMLTRCMLRLDDVDTEGREDVRSARRAAVKEVQSCIDKLEAKAEQRDRRLRKKDSSPQCDTSDDKESKGEVMQEENNTAEDPQKEEKEEETKSGDHEQTKL